MMDFINEVYNTLTIGKLPVTYIIRHAKSIPSISYHFFGEVTTLFGDGKPRRAEIKCQVDLWTRDGQDAEYIHPIRMAMKKAGWRPSKPDEDNYQEPDTGLYHRVFIFRKEYHVEEDDS